MSLNDIRELEQDNSIEEFRLVFPKDEPLVRVIFKWVSFDRTPDMYTCIELDRGKLTSYKVDADLEQNISHVL